MSTHSHGRHGIRVRRVYDPPEAGDGKRVLVDRLWPRGLSKEKAAVDAWDKDVTPSAELRTWYHADREHRYEEFCVRYAQELDDDPVRSAALAKLRELVRTSDVTLLTSAKDVAHSHVPVLVEHLG